MASLRKYALTKKDLIDNGYFVEGEKVFKNCTSNRCRGIREIKQRVFTKKSKRGPSKSYIYVFMFTYNNLLFDFSNTIRSLFKYLVTFNEITVSN